MLDGFGMSMTTLYMDDVSLETGPTGVEHEQSAWTEFDRFAKDGVHGYVCWVGDLYTNDLVTREDFFFSLLTWCRLCLAG